MRKLAAAETILALVMSRDRAASTVGDLLESPLGPLAFWRSVASAALGAVFRQLGLLTVLKAGLLYFLCSALFSIPYTLVLLRFQPQGWFGLLAVSGNSLLHAPACYVVARWLPGREAGTVVAAILYHVIMLLALRITTGMESLPIFPPLLTTVLPLLIGFVLARRRTLRLGVHTA